MILEAIASWADVLVDPKTTLDRITDAGDNLGRMLAWPEDPDEK